MIDLQLVPGDTVAGKYRIIEKLGEGSQSVVYRVEERPARVERAFKVLKHRMNQSHIENIVRFKRELDIIAGIDHPGIIKVFGSGEYKGMPFIIREQYAGTSLSDALDAGTVFTMEEAVQIVQQVADALAAAHAASIIHRDIRPANIALIKNNGALQVRLTGFGVSLLTEYGEFKSAEIETVYGCMSPEATGILKRKVDERSDLYSLGVVLYRLLTGRYPFAGADIKSLMYQHVAAKPESPRSINAAVSPVLEKIVMKLLVKEPESRYQSAKGLLNDLSRFERGDNSFAVGENDQKVRLDYHTRLEGRETELNQLKKAVQHAAQGEGQFIFVSGEAGIGKTRLAQELRSYVYEQGGVLFESRLFNRGEKTPYQPFRDIINGYIDEVAKFDSEQKKKETDRIRGVLGELGQLAVKLNERMSMMLDTPAPLVPLDAERETQRFMMVSANLLCNIAAPWKLCVMFIDDLQWADAGTLSLLDDILGKIRKSNLLLIGTYRHYEVNERHPVMRLKKEAAEKSLPLTDIRLAPLGYNALNAIVSGILGEYEEKTNTLTQFLLDKSKGNLFFAINIIRELVESNAIVWNKGYWKEDLTIIRTMKVSEDMADIILHRIEDLSPEHVRLMQAAAVIGREFSIELLHRVSGMERERMVQIIDDTITRQIVEEGGERGRYVFAHDRIRDTFYQDIDGKLRSELHASVARHIEDLHRANLFPVLFDLVSHLTKSGDRTKLREYLLPAAIKAKESYANDEAVKYYQATIELLEEGGQKAGRAWMQAKEDLAEVYLMTGKSDEAIDILREIPMLKENPVEKVRIYRNISSAWFRKAHWYECEKNIATGLALLGERIPRAGSEAMMVLARELFKHILFSLFPKFFQRRAGEPVEEENREKVRFYMTLNWMYMLSDTMKVLGNVVRMLNIAQRTIGPSRELAMCTASYASVCMAIPLFGRAKRFHLQALELRRKYNDRWGEAQSLQWLGFCHSWNGEHRIAEKYFSEARDLFGSIGDVWELDMTLNGLAIGAVVTGEYNKAIEIFSQYDEIAHMIRDEYAINSILAHMTLVYTHKGDFDEARASGEESLTLSAEKKIWFSHCYGQLNFGYLEMEQGNYDEAIKHLEISRAIYERENLLKNYTVHVFSFLADAYLERHRVAAEKNPLDLKNANRLSRKGLFLSRFWPNHYGTALRVRAKYFAAQRKFRYAEELFLKAILQTKSIGFKYEQARSHYEYGRFLKAINRDSESRQQMVEALALFKDIDARVYIDRIQQGATENQLSMSGTAAKHSSGMKLEAKMTAVLDATKQLAAITEIPVLIPKILEYMTELMGAERGVLFLYPEMGDKTLEIKSMSNFTDEELHADETRPIREIVSRVEHSGKRLISADAAEDFAIAELVSISGSGIRSLLCVPIVLRGDILGVVYLDNNMVRGLFTRDDLWMVDLILAQAGKSIEAARMAVHAKGIS